MPPDLPSRTPDAPGQDSPGRGRPLRVAIAEDAPVVKVGLGVMLRSGGLDLVDLPENVIGLAAVDIVIYDPQRGVPPGFEAPVRGPRPTLVAFSWSTRPDTETLARSQGAKGLLSKELTATRLVRSVEAAHAGTLDGYSVASETDPGQRRLRRPDGLTAREAEMLEMITRGMSNDEIAGTLYLSINSVKTYIRTAYRKIGVTRRPQAVLWGIHHGFGADAPGGYGS